MGKDATTSVAGPWGELHDTKGVWIGDGSAFPTASGTNPMVPCQVPKDEHDQADADQRGGQEGTPHRLSVSAATVLTTSLLSVTPARDQPKSQCHWAQGWASYPNTGRNLKRAGEGVNDVLISGD